MRIDELFANWSERDSRYLQRRRTGLPLPLSEDEISSIRAYRLGETSDLKGSDQGLARVALSKWIPPVAHR